MENIDESQSRAQIWTIRLIASMHFTRLFSLHAVYLILIFSFNRTFTIADIIPVLFFIAFFSLDFLIGFFLLQGKTVALLLSFTYAVLIFMTNFLRLIYPFFFDFMTLPFYSSLIEILLIIFMGFLWLNRKWVRDPKP